MRLYFHFQLFKRQPHKMIKHNQKIICQKPKNCLGVFDHFCEVSACSVKLQRRFQQWHVPTSQYLPDLRIRWQICGKWQSYLNPFGPSTSQSISKPERAGFTSFSCYFINTWKGYSETMAQSCSVKTVLFIISQNS